MSSDVLMTGRGQGIPGAHCVPRESTCVKGHGSIVDFGIVSRNLALRVNPPWVDQESELHPHHPVHFPLAVKDVEARARLPVEPRGWGSEAPIG
eukprot:5105612-Pyramimonas_sp.AAC.1